MAIISLICTTHGGGVRRVLAVSLWLCCHESLNHLFNFVYFWLCWILIAVQAFLSLRNMRTTLYLPCVGFSLHGSGFSCCRARALGHSGFSSQWLTGLWSTDSVLVAHGLSCSAACRIFPDQGSNPCLLHWQVNSLPLSHQGSP